MSAERFAVMRHVNGVPSSEAVEVGILIWSTIAWVKSNRSMSVIAAVAATTMDAMAARTARTALTALVTATVTAPVVEIRLGNGEVVMMAKLR